MQYLTPTATHVSAAEQAFYRGDRESAYQLVRAALLCDPQSIDAWLWLSKLVDDTFEKRECFERVLSIDPTNRAAKDGLEILRLKQLLSSLQLPGQQGGQQQAQIGAYLIAQKMISAEQLHEALRYQQQQRRRGNFTQLGDIFLRNGWLTPQQLAKALVSQLTDRLSALGSKASPRLLGEYLLADRLISAQQLEAALAEQMRLGLLGQRVALGSLLLRNKAIDAAHLHAVLNQQRAEFYSRFGD